MSKVTTINPATNLPIADYELHSDHEVASILIHSQQTYSTYKRTSIHDKSKMMLKVSEILLKNKAVYAQTMTDEMGKTISSSIAEIEKCAWVCRFYAEKSEEFLQDELITTDAFKSYISYRPLGVLLAIMPWNYPFWQVFRFAAPALMAGNTCVLKHASNVPASALYIQQIFSEAGFPNGAFTTLLISSDQVANVIENPIIKAVSLTGSGPAGSAVASLAGKHIKPTILELGGSDPYIILEDADIDLAAEQCVNSRLINNGQSCIGAKRFIVLEAIYEQFLVKFKGLMEDISMGDPNNNVDIGPMARIDLRDEVHLQVVKSIEAGAECILGGKIPDKKGAFYPPTILTNVKPGMPAYSDEIFGPVASVIKVANEQEAVRIANDTEFGLGACVFTKNQNRGERIVREELEAGCCFVNQFVKSDPRLPFGGVKTSGYGRELSKNGIRAFVNIKTVYVK